MSRIIKTTKIFKDVLSWFLSDDHFLVLEGGTSSSKTYSAIQALINISETDPEPKRTSIVCETFPQVKAGPILDFVEIMGDKWEKRNWNASDHVYTFPNTGSVIEFFGANNDTKVRGPRRDRLYINEANRVDRETFIQLKTRTRDRKYIIDHNPTKQYWAHDEKGEPGVRWNHSTYLDAYHVLPKTTIEEIESMKKNKNWWRVYGLGLVGKVEGLIYPEYYLVDEMPEGFPNRYGLDWGFTNDPTALIGNTVTSKEIYLQQFIYQKGMLNNHIAKRFDAIGMRKRHQSGAKPIWADQQEQKSIEELYGWGFNIKGAPRPTGFKHASIDFIQRYKMCVLRNSVDLRKELDVYSWDQDKNGLYLNEPEDGFDHLMDALIYSVADKIKPPSTISGGHR